MKVAFRYHPSVRIWQGNHMVDHPGSFSARLDYLAIREYQYRSFEHLIRKVRNGKAAYDATTLAPTEGQHWRDLGAMSDSTLAEWWADYCSQPALFDPAFVPGV
jgi:hypothetical protein